MFAIAREAAGAALEWRRDQHAAQARLADLRGEDRSQLRALGLAYEDLDQAPRWQLSRRAGLRAEINAADEERGELAAEIAECEQTERAAGDLADKAEDIADLLARAERQQPSPGPALGGTALHWVRRVVPQAGRRPSLGPLDGRGDGQDGRPAARRGIGRGVPGQAGLA